MNEITEFKFEFRAVRSMVIDGAPWFVGRDICGCLDLSNPRSSMTLLDDDEKRVELLDTPGGPQKMVIVSEAGLYQLVFQSRKQEAKPFKRWLAHEVLPAIRKTGRYTAPGATPEFDDNFYETLDEELKRIRQMRLEFGAAVSRRAGMNMPAVRSLLPDNYYPDSLAKASQPPKSAKTDRIGQFAEAALHAELARRRLLVWYMTPIADGTGRKTAARDHKPCSVAACASWDSRRRQSTARSRTSTSNWSRMLLNSTDQNRVSMRVR